MATQPNIRDSVIRAMELMAGHWQGRGHGTYPTIEPFEYEEQLHLEWDERYPLVHYEQKTVLLPDREPSHWESGFIRPVEDDIIEVSNAQDSGRVEVLRGRVDYGGPPSLLVKITLESHLLGHDPRLVQTAREWNVLGDRFDYVKQMATSTTVTPCLQPHLKATLQRVRH